MSKLLEILEQIQDSEAALSALEKSSTEIRASRSFLLNLKSVQKRKDLLEEQFLQLTDETGVSVCSYRLFPKEKGQIKVSRIASALEDFQSWFTVVFDAIQTRQPKERARIDADIASASAFDFAYSFQGSVGIVLTMPNEKLLIGETNLDHSFNAMSRMAKSVSTEQVAEFAKTYGIAAVRKMYRWADDLARGGLGVDIKWRRGADIDSSLFAEAQELEVLKTAIESSSEEKVSTVEFTGKLVGLDVTLKRFHMETDDREDIKGSIAPIIGTQHTLEIPHRYKITVQVKRKIHYATEREDVSYFLLGVE
jgi:hypothetical protein